MYREVIKGWLKHLDFMILDAVILEFSLLITYFSRHGFGASITREYKDVMLMVILLHIVATFFMNSYEDVIRRGYLVELKKSLVHCVFVTIGLIVWMFAIQGSDTYSRLVIFGSYPVSVSVMWIGRLGWKRVIRKRINDRKEWRKLLVVTTREKAEETLNSLMQPYRDYMFAGVVIYDESTYPEKTICNVPVVANKKTMLDYIQNHIVDEIFLDLKEKGKLTERLVDIFINMGLTVHMNLMPYDSTMEERRVHSFGNYMVMTTSMKFASPWQVLAKRMLDISGALVGLVLTGIAIVIFGPIIKKQSPGPILFSQKRVGRNGRIFNIYKIRTMYPDAEERKKELMEKNKMSGLMFKMDNDPRIFPIGHFLRKTSIDELPQFWNVLIGDMSLVGTRPPTVDEYEQYELGHRKRLAMKPGLTGMWQVSGRSDITDFDEVVALDAKYIEQWNITLDIKILWKTVLVVLTGSGAV